MSSVLNYAGAVQAVIETTNENVSFLETYDSKCQYVMLYVHWLVGKSSIYLVAASSSNKLFYHSFGVPLFLIFDSLNVLCFSVSRPLFYNSFANTKCLVNNYMSHIYVLK